MGELRARAATFDKAIGSKESGFSGRSGARKALFDLFDKADRLLSGRIDNLMGFFQVKDSEFYEVYWKSRSVKNIGLGTSGSEFPLTELSPSTPAVQAEAAK